MKNDSSVLQIFNESGAEIPVQKKKAGFLLHSIAEKERCRFSFVELVYVSEDEIIRINEEHLNRDYITDIISFRYDEAQTNDEIEGTLFCCAPRIKEQAEELGEPENQEFFRIFIHGLLHLIGYNDASAQEKKKMTELENKYLALLHF